MNVNIDYGNLYIVNVNVFNDNVNVFNYNDVFYLFMLMQM